MNDKDKSNKQMPRILGVIPARGGSKRLPGKNIMPLNGRSLLGRVYDAAKHSRYITQTLLSSDDETILEHGRTLGMNVTKRPPELATDQATSAVVVEHLIPALEQKGQYYDYIVLMQATSPLVQTSDIDGCIERAFQSDVQNCITTYPNKDPKTGLYPPNGAAYTISVEQFKRFKQVTIKGYSAYQMPQQRCIDIDTKDDFDAAEAYVKTIEV
jgi:CMP-N-acetylneuraminic acid synthetase